jgi:hypothetical protein
METILKIMGGALGILVPILLIYTLNSGISKAPFPEDKKKSYRILSMTFIIGWTGLVWMLSIRGVFSYHIGDQVPRFLIALFVPALTGILLLLDKTFRVIIDHISVSLLVGVQTFRLAGFAFLIIAGMDILPKAFSSGGYGDILTGALAIIASRMLVRKDDGSKLFFWAFNLSGLIDLLNVAFLLLYYYPIWNHSEITSAAAFDFSIIMIPAIAAPVALILHFYSIRNYLFIKK